MSAEGPICRVSWTVFESEGCSVEAQIFQPAQKSDKAILFCPGFPGMGAGVFEQRHAITLAAAGYDLIVLRHNGMRLDGPHAPMMVNNAGRLSRARQAGDTHLGGGPATVQEWLEEPLTALKNISKAYSDIFIIGNSFGALSALYSLSKSRSAWGMIRHVLLMAGAQGIAEDGHPFDSMRIWRPEFVSMPQVTEKVSLDTPESLVATMKATFEVLPGMVNTWLEAESAARGADLPITYLVVEKDELLRLEDTERFRAAIGGRGRIVVDTVDRPYPAYNLIAHDMPDYKTEDLCVLLGI